MSLREEFKDKDYRQSYAESLANTIIATQIRLLRGKMTQKEFAELAGIKQSRVSAMEDENYSMWSTKTLKKLAASKDVVFLGKFVSFGELLNLSRALSEEALAVSPYEEDPVISSPEMVTTSTTYYYKAVPGSTVSVNNATTTYSVVTDSVNLAQLPQKETPRLKLVSRKAA